MVRALVVKETLFSDDEEPSKTEKSSCLNETEDLDEVQVASCRTMEASSEHDQSKEHEMFVKERKTKERPWTFMRK
jgi:hypothetical protein